MVAVPAEIPLTMPVAETEALALPLLHTPPDTVSVRAIEAASQTTSGPLIAPALGSGFTVIILLAAAVPQLLVTV